MDAYEKFHRSPWRPCPQSSSGLETIAFRRWKWGYDPMNEKALRSAGSPRTSEKHGRDSRAREKGKKPSGAIKYRGRCCARVMSMRCPFKKRSIVEARFLARSP
jgi:hypothetical protein